MENLDTYILTTVVVILFVTFIIVTYKEFNKIGKDAYVYDPSVKKYGRDALFDLAVKLFEEKGLTPKVTKKKKAHKAMQRTIADMESDGVYFPRKINKS